MNTQQRESIRNKLLDELAKLVYARTYPQLLTAAQITCPGDVEETPEEADLWNLARRTISEAAGAIAALKRPTASDVSLRSLRRPVGVQ